jgi:hypothetical protein
MALTVFRPKVWLEIADRYIVSDHSKAAGLRIV